MDFILGVLFAIVEFLIIATAYTAGKNAGIKTEKQNSTKSLYEIITGRKPEEENK